MVTTMYQLLNISFGLSGSLIGKIPLVQTYRTRNPFSSEKPKEMNEEEIQEV